MAGIRNIGKESERDKSGKEEDETTNSHFDYTTAHRLATIALCIR